MVMCVGERKDGAGGGAGQEVRLLHRARPRRRTGSKSKEEDGKQVAWKVLVGI